MSKKIMPDSIVTLVTNILTDFAKILNTYDNLVASVLIMESIDEIKKSEEIKKRYVNKAKKEYIYEFKSTELTEGVVLSNGSHYKFENRMDLNIEVTDVNNNHKFIEVCDLINEDEVFRKFFTIEVTDYEGNKKTMDVLDLIKEDEVFCKFFK